MQWRVGVHRDRHSFGVDKVPAEHASPPMPADVSGYERRHFHPTQLDRPCHAQRSPAPVPA